MQKNLLGDVSVNYNMFMMWRCIVSIAHADGKIDEKERTYLKSIFDGMENSRGLTAEQRSVLENDIENKQDTFELLKQINDPLYRGQILYFGLYLAKIDGVIDPTEKDLLDKLHLKITEGLDMDAIRGQVKGVVAREMAIHDVHMSYNRPQYDEGFGIMAYIDDLLLWLGIDVMGQK